MYKQYQNGQALTGPNFWMKYEIATCENAPGKVGGSVAVGRIVLFALIPGTSRLQSNIVKIYVFIVVHFGGSR